MTPSRRRLLLVAFWIPPRTDIGTLRSMRIIKYLREFDWDVDVVTARVAGRDAADLPFRCIETGYIDIKAAIKHIARRHTGTTPATIPSGGLQSRVTSGWALRAMRVAADFVTYPDEYAGWLPFALRKVHQLLSSRQYDALLTTSPPVSINIIGALAHGNIPWVADMRDLWAEDDSTERTLLQRSFDDKLERLTLSHAAVLTASSSRSAKRFARRFPGIECVPISTGFDADEWSDVTFGAEGPCTLLYAGNLYNGKRDPTVLFSALRSVFRENLVQRSDLRVDFYTAESAWLLKMIHEYDLDGIVRLRGVVDRRSILTAERRADRLIVLCWDGPTAEGIVPGKLFEYLGARRPILAIGGTETSNVRDILDETGAGVRCLSSEDVRREILRAVREHREAPRIISQAAVGAYAGEHCGSDFAMVLDSVVEKRIALRRQTAGA